MIPADVCLLTFSWSLCLNHHKGTSNDLTTAIKDSLLECFVRTKCKLTSAEMLHILSGIFREWEN